MTATIFSKIYIYFLKYRNASGSYPCNKEMKGEARSEGIVNQPASNSAKCAGCMEEFAPVKCEKDCSALTRFCQQCRPFKSQYSKGMTKKEYIKRAFANNNHGEEEVYDKVIEFIKEHPQLPGLREKINQLPKQINVLEEEMVCADKCQYEAAGMGYAFKSSERARLISDRCPGCEKCVCAGSREKRKCKRCKKCKKCMYGFSL